jgi:hypothetical protein
MEPVRFADLMETTMSVWPDQTLEETEIAEFDLLKPRLAKLWDSVFPGDEESYTSVIVPSLTLDEAELTKISGIPFYEERLLFLLAVRKIRYDGDRQQPRRSGEALRASDRCARSRGEREESVNRNTISRDTAVGRIRRQLIAMQEEGKSVCQIASEKNILCRGFHHDTDDELRWRYADRIAGAASLPRQELERRANMWQLERQRREGTLLCCDVQYMFNETCRAWDDFTNEELAQFCQELLGEQVRVIGGVSLPVV